MSVELIVDNTQATQASLDMAMPVARIKGELITDLPADLFIPPDALSVILDEFEGPLDLLLYLIRKHSLDILNIQMADLTRQYMVYVEAMRENQFELAAEYLLMAAVLIEIKSRMLLPRPPRENEAGPDDPRAELVRRLMEYEQMKAASQVIDQMPRKDRDFAIVDVLVERSLVTRVPTVLAADLTEAWRVILNRARATRRHSVTREELSVRSHMSRILRYLGGHGFVRFDELFQADEGVAVVVVSFLAVLELARELLIELSQSAAFEPIYVKLREAEPPLLVPSS